MSHPSRRRMRVFRGEDGGARPVDLPEACTASRELEMEIVRRPDYVRTASLDWLRLSNLPASLQPSVGEAYILGIRHRVRIWTSAQWAMMPDELKPDGTWPIEEYRVLAEHLMPAS